MQQNLQTTCNKINFRHTDDENNYFKQTASFELLWIDLCVMDHTKFGNMSVIM